MPEERSGEVLAGKDSAGNGAAGVGPALPATEATGRLARRRSGVSLRAIAFCALICVSAFALALHYAPSGAGNGKSSAEAAQQPVAPEPAPDRVAAEDPVAAEIAAAAAQPAPPSVAPRLARADTGGDALLPLAADNHRWGAAAARQARTDENLKRKLTEAGRRLKSLMDADAPQPPTETSAESPQLAYADPAEPAAAAAGDQEPFGDVSLVDARTRSAVNLRGAARKGAPVLEVIPGGAAIKVAAGGCRGWCPTVYNGRKGFIYKDYVQQAAAATPAAPAPTEAAGQPSEPATTEPAALPGIPTRQGGH